MEKKFTMDHNYRANAGKWLPRASSFLEKFIVDSSILRGTIEILANQVAALLNRTIGADYYDELKDLIRELEKIVPERRMLSQVTTSGDHIFRFKVDHLMFSMRQQINILAQYIEDLILEITRQADDEFLRMVLRLVNIYNELLNLDHDISLATVNIFSNDCPSMSEPLKKISVARLLQILAKNGAESWCHELIECLLAIYRSTNDEESKIASGNDAEISENSSIEIYRTLTKHITTPLTSLNSTLAISTHMESMQMLVNKQNDQVLGLLNVMKNLSPQLLGPDATKMKNDEMKIRKKALQRILELNQDIVWSSVSSILDHVVLWWSSEALAARHSHGSQHLKDWLHHFTQGNDVPSSVRPALQTLCDALGYHVTVTAWDQLFRLAYTAAFECHSKPSSEVSENCGAPLIEGTDTGQKFVDVFQLLMTLSNECEMGGEWVIGAPLAELPLSEQLVVLHRMDHSVHTVRLWAMQEARLIAHTWNLKVFFLLVKGDIVNCIDILSYVKLADHSKDLDGLSISVQVYVCAKMRAKIVSEVSANIQLLKDAPILCIKVLAKIARVISMANLKLCFPKAEYWKKNSCIAPSASSLYVKIYFERVLFPVLVVTDDVEIPNMVLRIMCEAWLDHIYSVKVKFSEWGALQLLADFAYVTSWVMECPIINEEVRQHLSKNEVLRRCEGVGRLLLRHPGEAISMNKKLPQRTNENGSPESLGLARMPAEMYVPNQEQWLELRASKRHMFCCTE